MLHEVFSASPAHHRETAPNILKLPLETASFASSSSATASSNSASPIQSGPSAQLLLISDRNPRLLPAPPNLLRNPLPQGSEAPKTSPSARLSNPDPHRVPARSEKLSA